jgi:hypothetical protein
LLERFAGRIGAQLKKNYRPVMQSLLNHLPHPYEFVAPAWMRWISYVVLVASLIATTTWNVITLPKLDMRTPDWIRTYALPMRLDQYWSMFAPYPMRADGWFVVDGVLKDGTSFDTWNKNVPVSWDKPDDFMTSFRSSQWRKHLYNIWMDYEDDDDTIEDIQLAFAKYVCREWNDLGAKPAGQQELETYELYYMKELTPPPGELPVISKTLLWTHNCFSKKEKTEMETPPPIRN